MREPVKAYLKVPVPMTWDGRESWKKKKKSDPANISIFCTNIWLEVRLGYSETNTEQMVSLKNKINK